MHPTPFRLLLLEDNEDDARLVQLALEKHAPGEFAITCVKRLADALAQIRTERFDAMLSDLGLPDSMGLTTVQAIAAHAPALPLVVLTGGSDEDIGREAIRYGAHDYLLKGESGGRSIARAIHYAIESKRLEIGLRIANEALERRVAERTLELESANRSLRESEQELRAIFDGALDGILVADTETRKILAANAAICGMLGYTHEEIVRIGVSDIHPKQDLPRVIEQFEMQLRGEIQMAADIPMMRKDGSVFYADIKAAPVRLGGKDCLLGIFRDITERKLAEEALARESHRNQVFLRNASDGVHILDSDGNVLEVSDSFCEMLGYSREELIGANVSLWDAQWSAQELKQRIAELLAKGSRTIFQTRHRRRDGRLLDVEIIGQGLELDGKPVLFNSARDITERNRAEQQLVEAEARFRGLVEQSIAGIYIIQDGTFAYVNPRFAEIRGYGSANEVIGRDPLQMIDENDRATVAENNRRLLAGEMPSIDYTFIALRKDGSNVEVGVHSARATYRGRPAIIGLLQDISEKKRAEEQIQHYVAQARKRIHAAPLRLPRR